MDVLFRKESDLNSTCILIMSIFIFIRHSQSFFMDAQFIIFFFCFDSSLQREAKLSLQLALAPFSSCSCYNFSAQNLFLHTISSVQNQMLYNNCQLVLAVHTRSTFLADQFASRISLIHNTVRPKRTFVENMEENGHTVGSLSNPMEQDPAYVYFLVFLLFSLYKIFSQGRNIVSAFV